MKSPADLTIQLSRQWENADLREERLLGAAEWPLRLAIGRPSAAAVDQDWVGVSGHIRRWRAVGTGTVVWQPVTYRATGEGSVDIPVAWEFADADQWVQAAASRTVTGEFVALRNLFAATDSLFHPLFVRRRTLWKDKPLHEVIQAADLALQLAPGCAGGAPLRSLSLAGIDTKFFERHRSLILSLLDLRFDGEPSRQGLEVFLGARQDNDHWILLADLDGHLLPFPQIRACAIDLAAADLLFTRLLIIENERCLHLLPFPVPGTLAVLGVGNSLQWMSAPWVQRARVAYWGDLDTWGFTLLAQARRLHALLTPIMMSQEVFDQFADRLAVPEPITAGSDPPNGLLPSEAILYRHLLASPRGRLEQEFLPRQVVVDSVMNWLAEQP